MPAASGSRPIPRRIGSPRTNRGNQNPIVLGTPAGTGFTSGTGGFYDTGIQRDGDIIYTQIVFDLTGLASSTTDLDIIGVGANPAHFGRIVTVESGTIIGGTITCLEVPAGGVSTIDFYSATQGTGVFDGGIAALTETAMISASGAWTLGLSTGIGADSVPANNYLYAVGGAAGTAATYTAGRFLVELIGI
jgi:hypothetical protein